MSTFTPQDRDHDRSRDPSPFHAPIPLRPETLRSRIRSADANSAEFLDIAAIDPGLALARSIVDFDLNYDNVLIASRYWNESTGAIERLWRHGVAASLAATAIARIENRPDSEDLAKFALVHQLGYWLIAADDPILLEKLLAERDPARRRRLERDRLGADAANFAGDWAERSRIDPRLADASRLHAKPLSCWEDAAADPRSLAILQKAFRIAERTPWALFAQPTETSDDPRFRNLVAKVNRLCRDRFVADPVSTAELNLFREVRTLKLENTKISQENDILKKRLIASEREIDRIERRSSREIERKKLAALAEFAAGLGHELNNPLAVILGRAQLLKSPARKLDADAIKSVQAIIDQAIRGSRMIKDLMGVAGGFAIRIRDCRPNAILRTVVADLQTELKAKNIALELDLDPKFDRGAIASDPDALAHLAETFLRNAIEATETERRVKIRSTFKHNRMIWSFWNERPPLASDVIERLFDPFFCGREAGRGLGLGLPRAARIVRDLGGSIRFRSPSNEGVLFVVVLPIKKTANEFSGDRPRKNANERSLKHETDRKSK
jgi:signal transduction histidine kinase